MREVGDGNTRLAEAILHGVDRESLVSLFPGEALLLSGRDDLTIAQQARGAVVIVGRNAKNSGQATAPRRLPSSVTAAVQVTVTELF